MLKNAKITIVFLVGLCFLMAVFEIDAFGYDHTFFDSCDSYVQSSNTGLHFDHKTEKTKSPLSIIAFTSQSFVLFTLPSITTHSILEALPSKKFVVQKLFLKKLSLLI